MKKVDSKLVTFRFEYEEIEMLDELSKLYKKSKSLIVRQLVRGEHDKVQGNPQLKMMIEKLQEIEGQMKEFTVLADNE